MTPQDIEAIAWVVTGFSVGSIIGNLLFLIGLMAWDKWRYGRCM